MSGHNKRAPNCNSTKLSHALRLTHSLSLQSCHASTACQQACACKCQPHINNNTRSQDVAATPGQYTWLGVPCTWYASKLYQQVSKRKKQVPHNVKPLRHTDTSAQATQKHRHTVPWIQLNKLSHHTRRTHSPCVTTQQRTVSVPWHPSEHSIHAVSHADSFDVHAGLMYMRDSLERMQS